MISYSFSKCKNEILSSIVAKKACENTEYISYISLANGDIYESDHGDFKIFSQCDSLNSIEIDRNVKTLYIIQESDSEKINNLISQFKDYDNLILVFCSQNKITNSNIDKKYELSGYDYIDAFDFKEFKFDYFKNSDSTNDKFIKSLDQLSLPTFIIFSILASLVVFLESFFYEQEIEFIFYSIGITLSIVFFLILTNVFDNI